MTEELKQEGLETNGANELSAINIDLKTLNQVKEEFTSGLGFDPSNLDELSQQFEGIDVNTDSSEEHVRKLLEMQQGMTDMLIERFQNNMEAFKKYIPDIYRRFHNYHPTETIEFLCTSNGNPNLFFTERNEFFYKAYDPVALCNKQVDIVLERCPFKQLRYNVDQECLGQIHHRYLNDLARAQDEWIPDNSNPLLSNSCPIAVIVGIGLGYHIGHLYESIEIGNLILIEPNIDLFFASLHAFDWANLLDFINQQHRGIYLMVGQTKEEVFEDLNSFYDRHGRMLAGFMWSMVHYRSKEINEIADKIVEDYERSFATLGFLDDHMFGLSHSLYLATHHARFVRYDVDLPEYILNIPLCVVANGPSLTKDLPLLRKIQDKVIILACGTALETLYNAGIKPFFYGATERLRVVSESLSLIPDQDYIKDIILLTSDVIHPETFKMFKDTAIFGKADETFFSLAARNLYERYRKVNGICLMNPLVGNFGVAAAGQLKFHKIYMFGVDNGTKREDRATHPDESWTYNKDRLKHFYEKEQEQIKQLEQVHKDRYKKKIVPQNITMNILNSVGEGNFGGHVYTSYIYKLSALYMRVIINTYSKDPERDLHYFNCSDGLKVEGAEPLHSETLWDEWSKLPDVDFDKLKRFIREEKTFDIDLSEEEAVALCKYDTFDCVVDTIIKGLKREKRPKTRLEFVFLMQSICEMITVLRHGRDAFIAEMLDGSIYNYFIMVIRVLYLTADEKEAIKRAEAHVVTICDFLEDAKKLYRHMPYYYAEDHQKFLNNKVGFDHPDSKAPDLVKRVSIFANSETKSDKFCTSKFVKRYE